MQNKNFALFDNHSGDFLRLELLMITHQHSHILHLPQ
jgi:hypothetical protein